MIMATRKISVTLDVAVLNELHKLEGPNANVSALVNEALVRRNKQKRLTAWLDDMDRRDPMSPQDVAAGEELWQRIVSSSTPARSRRSRTATKSSVSSSGKR